MPRAIRRLLSRCLTRTAAGPAALVSVLFVLVAGALSALFTLTYRGGNVLLATLDSGTLRLQVVTDHVHAPTYTDCVWAEIYHPSPVPDTGVLRHPANCLEWTLPSVHRTFVSVTGTWWTFTLPLWCCLALGLLVLWFSRRRRRVDADLRAAACAPEGNRDGGPSTGRRWLLWASALASFLVLAVWLLSGWWSTTISTGRRWNVFVWAGVISIETIPEQFAGYWADAPPVGVYRSDEPFQLGWTLPHTADCAQSTVGAWWELNIPLWMVFLAVCAPLILALYRRLHRRAAPGTCARCGYNLTGNLSGRCPECGLPTCCGDQA